LKDGKPYKCKKDPQKGGKTQADNLGLISTNLVIEDENRRKELMEMQNRIKELEKNGAELEGKILKEKGSVCQWEDRFKMKVDQFKNPGFGSSSIRKSGKYPIREDLTPTCGVYRI
jgi:predicted nuclease with TOPRIM domain